MTDSLNETVSFKYNFKDELVQIKPVNLWYPGYDYTLNFTYDNDGNVTMVINVPESGASYTTYAATSYDHRPNFLGGNPWLKYILFQTGFEPFYYLLYSKNNAANWTWFYDSSDPGYVFTSTFNYDSEGFANRVSLHAVDTQGNLIGDFTQTASSTCDNNPYPTKQTSLPSKRQVLPQLNRNMPAGRFMNK